MTESTFRVVFSGEALPGFNQNIAIDNLAKLLKRTPEQVSGSFNGRSSVIKKGITAAEAERYCQVLERAGLLVHAEQDPATPTGAVAAPGNPAPAAESKLALTLVPIEDESQAAASAVRTEMICPACGHKQPKAERCDACGVMVAKFLQRQIAKPGEGK